MINLEPCALLGNVYDRKVTGYRLVQISCTKLPDFLELIYSFDLNYQLIHYKLQVNNSVPIPSISPFYAAAFLYENEIHDLFGIQFKHMTVDYEGSLYKVSVPTPFNPVSNEMEEMTNE